MKAETATQKKAALGGKAYLTLPEHRVWPLTLGKGIKLRGRNSRYLEMYLEKKKNKKHYLCAVPEQGLNIR